MNKKGQAALEFLMTYGWAILVVLAAIGALAYFGVLNPTRFTPDTCIASSGFGCNGKPVITGVYPSQSLLVSIQNGLGYNMNNIQWQPATTLNCSGFSPAGGGNVSSGYQLNDSTTTLYSFSCSLLSGTIAKGVITIKYTNPQSGLPEQQTISITTKVP